MQTVMWLWAWYIVGAWANMFKRAWIKVKGPDTSITTYSQYFSYFWPVLLFRALGGAVLYWITFYPDVLADVIRRVGWSSLGTFPELPHYGFVALAFGLAGDWLLDTISMHVTWFQDFIPPLTLAAQAAKR